MSVDCRYPAQALLPNLADAPACRPVGFVAENLYRDMSLVEERLKAWGLDATLSIEIFETDIWVSEREIRVIEVYRGEYVTNVCDESHISDSNKDQGPNH